MIHIDKITIAVSEMEKMVQFYAAVFDIEFDSLDLYGTQLYSAHVGEMEILLCPKSVADVEAEINTIQLRFVVPDAAKAYQRGIANDGTGITDVQEVDGVRHGSLRDPDGNSLELVESS